MKDMLRHIAEELKKSPELKSVVIKPYARPESLKQESSLVIIPIGPPRQETIGSNKPLRKEFTYQINAEATQPRLVKELAIAAEKIMLELGFYQLPEGLDEYFEETKRYVDARRYRGHSKLYETDY